MEWLGKLAYANCDFPSDFELDIIILTVQIAVHDAQDCVAQEQTGGSAGERHKVNLREQQSGGHSAIFYELKPVGYIGENEERF